MARVATMAVPRPWHSGRRRDAWERRFGQFVRSKARRAVICAGRTSRQHRNLRVRAEMLHGRPEMVTVASQWDGRNRWPVAGVVSGAGELEQDIMRPKLALWSDYGRPEYSVLARPRSSLSTRLALSLL